MAFWQKKIIEKVFVPKHVKQKFDIGQKVYMIANDQLTDVEIKEASVLVFQDGYKVHYVLKNSPYGSGMRYRGFEENELFATKDELAKSLIL